MDNLKAGLFTFAFFSANIGYIWMIIATVKNQDTIVEKIFYILFPWPFIIKQGIDKKGRVPLGITLFGIFMGVMSMLID